MTSAASRSALRPGIATFFTGYFARVMATGIIAVGAHFEGLDWVDDGLFVVAVLAYLVIAVLTTLRIVRDPRLVLADMTSHARE